MTSKKDKQIRGLKKILVVVSILFTVSVIAGFGMIKFNEDLESQFQSCQEKVPVLVERTVYLLADGSVHTVVYFPENHSYTIDNLFTCNGEVFYSSFPEFFMNCEVLK